MKLSDYKDALARAAHGMTAAEAHAQRICIKCKQPPTFQTDAGRKEYEISALCEPCFDQDSAVETEL